MTTRNQTRTVLALAAVVMAILVLPAAAREMPAELPDPDGIAPETSKPVKVYILAGQSNMVGIGQISGGSSRWGKQFLDPVVSIYPGEYSPTADYDKMAPIETKKLPAFGGVKPTPFPGGGTAVVRGFIKMETTGVYKFNAGYANSSYNIMEVDGVEVYRKEVGKEAVHAEFKFSAGKKHPFKITFLTKAANGLGWVWRTDIPGTLDTVVKTDKKFPHLVDDTGNWTVRNDVWYKGVVTATANKWLTVGCGSGAGTIGPELQFGHIMGYYHDEPVIIIKASQGNRSLGWDILPPGSERFTFDGRTYAGYKDTPSSWIEGEPKREVNWYAGKQYDDFVKGIHDVLDNFDTHFPQYKDQGYEIGGFVWWQGHKDGNPAHASRYEQNLVHLIKTLRKEFKVPKAPFVIGTIGFGGWKMAGPHLTVANAQLAVSGDKGKYPEFAGNVLTVETRDFWIDESLSPRNQGFHYNGNAETYLLVGDALGRGMVQLLGILAPALSKARKQAKRIVGISNQRSIVRAANLYGMDNDALYPESVATVGPEGYWNWQEPMKLVGYSTRSPRVNRSTSAYLRTYIKKGSVMYCPGAPRKFRYLEKAWAAGDEWDNPETPLPSDPLSGTYCLYWNYTGYLEGKEYLFQGPRTSAGGGGQSRLLVSDYFGYDYYESPNAYGSCEKFKGASPVKETMLISGYWAGTAVSSSPKPEIKLSAGFVDGHVESYSSSDTATMRVIWKPDIGEPYPHGIGPGEFYIPQSALH